MLTNATFSLPFAHFINNEASAKINEFKIESSKKEKLLDISIPSRHFF